MHFQSGNTVHKLCLKLTVIYQLHPTINEECKETSKENLYVYIQWNPDFTNLQWKRKLVRKIAEVEKSGVKLQCSTEEGKRLLVRVIGRFAKLTVREIGIPL